MAQSEGLVEKAQKLKALHRPGNPLVLANAWDAATARVIEETGAGAVATTSAGVAFAHGYPDGERIPRDRMLAAISIVCASVSVPVTADVEAGYGPTPEDVRATVRGDPALLDPVHQDMVAVCARRAPGHAVVPLVGDKFYERVRRAHTIVATSEPRLYGNMILRKGVIYPEGAKAQ